MAAVPTPQVPAAPTPHASLESDAMKGSNATFACIVVAALAGVGLVIVGIKLGPRIQAGREERAEFDRWREQNQKIIKRTSAAPAARPWVSSGGKTAAVAEQQAVAERERLDAALPTDPPPSLNGSAPHSG